MVCKRFTCIAQMYVYIHIYIYTHTHRHVSPHTDAYIHISVPYMVVFIACRL